MSNFAYRGVLMECPEYEIDGEMNVRRNGRDIARSGAWKIELAGSQFDVRRLRLAVHRPLPLHIERDSGIRRNRAFPLDDARAYEYETPADRATATNDARWRSTTPGDIAVLKPGPRPWTAVRYPDRERDFSLLTFAAYEMHRITGKVRRVATQAPIAVTRNNTIHLEFDGKRVVVSWHVAYMSTFRWSCRFPDQTEINRIDGDATNNSVWNFRWASPSEGKLYSWRRKEPRHAVAKFSGDTSTLREYNGWKFGPDGTVVNPQGNVRTFKVHRTAPYPVVNIEGERYRVHRIVAHLFLGLTLRELTDPVTTDRIVMHVNDIKTDFRVANLRVGSQQENMRGVKRPGRAPEESANTDHAISVARAWISGGTAMSVGEALIALPAAAASDMAILHELVAMFRPHVDDPAGRVAFAAGVLSSSGLEAPRAPAGPPAKKKRYAD